MSPSKQSAFDSGFNAFLCGEKSIDHYGKRTSNNYEAYIAGWHEASLQEENVDPLDDLLNL